MLAVLCIAGCYSNICLLQFGSKNKLCLLRYKSAVKKGRSEKVYKKWKFHRNRYTESNGDNVDGLNSVDMLVNNAELVSNLTPCVPHDDKQKETSASKRKLFTDYIVKDS